MAALPHLAISLVLVLIGIISEAELTTPPPTGDLVFQPNSYYDITILETVQIGYSVIPNLNVTSQTGSGNIIALSCLASFDPNSTACDAFSLVALSSDNTKWFGRLTVAQSLDAVAKSSYFLTLVASNGNSMQYQNVTVRVLTATSRPPVFQGTLTVNTPELYNISTTAIIQYTAQDGDRSDRPIRYQLSSNPGGYFRIEDVTGRLFNTQPILFSSTGWELGFMVIEVEAAVLLPSGVAGFGDPTTATKMPSTINLLESVDYAPTFDQTNYLGTVLERSPVNTVIQGISLKVSDINKSLLNSTFELYLDAYSNVFRVFPSNASRQTTASILVVNSTLIDYDAGPQTYRFNVIAREILSPLRLSNSSMVTINLYPKNDYPPVFTQSIYYVSINELITPGSVVLQVLATDKDIGAFGNISIRYKFGEYTSLFRMNQNTGVITVAPCNTLGRSPCIDYETVKSYSLPIVAADNYGEGFSAMATVNVTIIDANDNPPIFISSVFYGQINEHTMNPFVQLPLQTTSVPLQVNATDADSSFNGNNNVTYSIVGGNDNNLWSIDPFSGIITANRPINYTDSQGGFFYLSVQARDPDPTHIAKANVNISVNAVNFYPPVLTNNGTYFTSILETTLPGTFIMIIKANDGDSPATLNGMVGYRFLSGNQDLFTIVDVTGVVTVASGAKFDATVQNLYSISLQAYDLGTPQKTDDGNLYITIIPNRPEPKFTLSDIRPPPVLQSAPIGQNVTVVFANNTNPNRRIFYSFIEPITGRDSRNQGVTLTPADKQMFVVDPVSGVVTVNQPLNYDHVATWIAVVQAIDNNTNSTDKTGTATITITVQPVNDNPPLFSWPWTNQTRTINKTLIRWDIPSNNVFDIDASSPNSSLTITYQLTDDYNGAFNISNQTGVVGLTRPLNISRDTAVKLVVIAVDNGVPQLTSTATISVQLQNSNTMAPNFTQIDYSTTIFDDVQNGTYILTLNAVDYDYGDFGQVRYALTNSDNRFILDPITGIITIAPNAVFNGSRESLIILHVQAYDSPNNPIYRRSIDTTVQINVVTINKDPPRFSQPDYSISIPESTRINTTFIQVLATKGNFINPKVYYAIANGNDKGLFSIDSNSGSVQAQTSLVGKFGMYVLNVTATDDGTPQLTGSALVHITVLASSYQIPTWVQPAQDGAVVYINESIPRGTYVTTVNAINTNFQNGPVSYYFAYTANTGSNTTGDFTINATTGVITTARPIGYEGGSTFVVNVNAVDNFNTGARRTLLIVVLNVFAENPSFPIDPSDNCTIDIYWQISLNAPNGSIVNTLSASLTDPNDTINYYIISPNVSDYLFVLQPQPQPPQKGRSAQVKYFGNGVVKIPGMYNFTVRAQDENFNVNDAPKKMLCRGVANQTDVYVHINVIETKPQYDSDMHTCIRDDAEIGTNAYRFASLSKGGVGYVLSSVERYSGTGLQQTETGSSQIFNLSITGDVATESSMSNYKQQYFNVKAVASFDQLSFSYPVVSIYVVPYSSEVLVTFNAKPEDVMANISNITREILNATNGGKVCVVSYNYHVTDEGVVDPSRTDVLMYVIDGNTNVVQPLDLDKWFTLDARRRTHIIGITEAYSYWDGFLYHPVAAAIGIIIGLLVIALILFLCCCVLWSKLLMLCRYSGEKEPLIYKASSLGVVNPVWSPKPQTEEQVLTMPVPDGEGMNRTIELLGEYNRPAVDMGDEDVMDSASRFHGGAAAAGGAQSLSGYVHIEAPLTASRSPSAFGAPSAYGASQNRQETTTTYESSATGGALGGRESPYPGSHMSQPTSGAMDSNASYSASGAMKFSRGTAVGSPPPARSHSTGTMTNMGVGATVSEPDGPVRLNDPGDTGHAKIGATLFRPGGQAYAQSVISGTTMGDQYDVVGEGAGLYGAQHDARMTLPLDTEVMYSHMRPTSYYDDADIMPNHGGTYQGEVRVGRSSIASEQFQETRFM